MAEPFFFLRWKLDRPFVLQNRSEDVYALVTIEPNPAALPAADPSPGLPAHLILLVDVSQSMDYLIRHDPNAREVGEVLAEGAPATGVESDVPSRREVACHVVSQLVGRLGPDDLLSLVAFDDQAHVLASALPPTARAELDEAVRQLGEVGGGGTSLGQGLQAVRQTLLTTPEDPPRTRKLVILTDGEDQQPGLALAEASYAGRDHNIPIVAFGTGECKVAFLTELAKLTLGGSFNHIQNETEAENLFLQTLSGQKNVQATNASLKLWLSPEMYLRELYRTRPEILFVGEVKPDANNIVELRPEQMERGKAYEFLFRCTVPARLAGQRFRVAKATLTYDLPALDRLGNTAEANLVVEYTGDEQRARERSGDVVRVLGRAEVQRQVLFLQAHMDALRRGAGSDYDRAVAARLLRALVARFADLGDHAQANTYREMEEEFLSRGTISQDLLNRSLAASSRPEEAVVPLDMDF
jgi:Ca-activated chloride channel family protein